MNIGNTARAFVLQHTTADSDDSYKFEITVNKTFAVDDKQVLVTCIRIDGINDDTASSAEVLIYFDVGTWNVEVDGLLYYKDGFTESVSKWLMAQCNDDAWRKVAILCTSEQGMQSEDYVSCDDSGIAELVKLAAPDLKVRDHSKE